MSREISINKETLAKAAVIFCQKVHAAFPAAYIEPLDLHYSDEDLTLAVTLSAEADVSQASDELIRMALEVEDQYGVTIIARAQRG
jgi:hypothetical protein